VARGSRSGRESSGSPERSVFVAAIGKHPGWNDHIEDLGLDTEALADLRQVLYLEGIGGNIDHGTWEELDASQRVEGFDHEFVWRRGEGVIAGRMWSSRDGKGRRKYPMIVCAQAPAGGEGWLLHETMASLDELAAVCQTTEDPDRVREEVARARSRARASWAEGGGRGAGESHGSAARELAAASELGPDRLGMYRLLYHVDRDMGSFVRGGAGQRGESGRGAHVRVPRVMESPRAALELWLRFASERFAPSTPVMAIAPASERWVDLLVGAADTSRLACLRTGTEVTPVVTQIPYTIDEAFAAEADAWIERASSGGSAPSERRREGRPAGRATGASGLGRGKLVVVAAGIGLAVLLLVSLLLLVLGSNGGQSARAREGGGRDSAAVDGDGGVGAAETRLSAEHRAAWSEWCRAYAGWFGDLVRRLDLELARSDPHLARAVVPVLESRADELDPREATRSAVIDLAALAEDPPEDVRDEESVRRASRAVATLRGVREALGASAWPARRRVGTLAEGLEERGWMALAERLREVEEGISFESGASLAEGVHRLLRLEDRTSALAGAMERVEAATEALERTGEPPLTRAGEIVEAVFAEGRGAGAEEQVALGSRLTAVARTLEDAASFVRERWDEVDRAGIRAAWARAEEQASAGSGGLGAARIERWMGLAKEPRWVLLEPGDDPRRGLEAGSRVEALRARVALLARQGGPDARARGVDELMSRLGSVEGEAGALRELTWRRGLSEQIAEGVARVGDALDAIEREVDRLEREARSSFAEYVTGLGEESSISRTGSPAIDRAWRARRDALMEAYPEATGWEALHRGIESARATLHAIEEALPAGLGEGSLEGVLDRDAIESLVHERRERAIGEAIGLMADEDGGLAGAARAIERIDPVRERYRAWRGGMTEGVDRISGFTARLTSGAVAREPVARELLDRWGAWAEDPEMAPLVAASRALSDRVEAVRAAGSASSLEDILEAVEAAGAGPEAALVGWRRAGELEGVDLEAQGALLARARAAGDRLESSAASEFVRASAAARWMAAVEAASDRAGLAGVVGRRDEFGGDPASLAPARRALVALVELDARLAQLESGEEDSEAVVAAIEAAVARIEGIGASLTPELAGTVDRLRELARGAEHEPGVDYASLGPGKQGWEVEVLDGGDRVAYRAPGDGDVTLTFARVGPAPELGLARAAFVGTEEVSINALVAIVEAVDGWVELASLWGELGSARAGEELNRGPRGWRWDAGQARIVVAPHWLPAEEREGVYPSGGEPDPPGGSSPVQQISPRAAARVAEWVGCELPTPPVWRAAVSEHGIDAGAGSNLRDATWSRQVRHLREGSFFQPIWPDGGVFLPLGAGVDRESVPRGREAEPAVEGDDGVLWFAPVDAGGGGLVRHLVGNVAEFVRGGEGAGASFAVMGGSALSPRELKPEEAYEIRAFALGQGYWDVGFRVCFWSEGPPPVRARARRVLDEAPWAVGGE